MDQPHIDVARLGVAFLQVGPRQVDERSLAAGVTLGQQACRLGHRQQVIVLVDDG
jgi:hypothetical protein